MITLQIPEAPPEAFPDGMYLEGWKKQQFFAPRSTPRSSPEAVQKQSRKPQNSLQMALIRNPLFTYPEAHFYLSRSPLLPIQKLIRVGLDIDAPL